MTDENLGNPMTKHKHETARALALGILVPAIAATIAVAAVLMSGW